MKTLLTLTGVLTIAVHFTFGQGIAISDQSSPTVSTGAVLDVSSGTTNAKGFLPPRISNEKKAVTNKTSGLLYYFSNSKSYGYWTPNGWCSFVISGPYSESESETDTIIQPIMFTPLGGLAVWMRNMTGSTISKGMLVKASPDDDMAVVPTSSEFLNPTTEAMGVVYEDISNNSYGWIVISGIAEVLPDPDDTPTRGDIVRIHSTEDGYGDFSTTTSGIDLSAHSREIGYCIKSASAGQLAKVLLQF